MSNPLRVGIGGPVGSGKTALTLSLCRALRQRYRLAELRCEEYLFVMMSRFSNGLEAEVRDSWRQGGGPRHLLSPRKAQGLWLRFREPPCTLQLLMLTQHAAAC